MEKTTKSPRAAEEFRRIFTDPAALRSWFDSALPKVFAFAFARCGGIEEVARDIAQETFLEVVRSRDSFDGRSDPVTWVIAIARNKIADHYRRIYRDRRLELVEVEAPEQRVETDSIDDRTSVLAAIDQLPEAQRVVLAMHYLDDLSVKEIASKFGRSEHAVESLLARGRAGFKRAYLDRSEER